MKYIILSIFALFSLFACQAKNDAMVTIHGMIHTADGKAPQMAHILIAKPMSAYENQTGMATAADGSFKISIPYYPALTLRASAVNHTPRFFSIMPKAPGDDIQLDIYLSPYPVPAHPENVQVSGDWNRNNINSGDKMEKTADGRFHYTVHKDTGEVAFQIVNATTSMRTINAPGSKRFRPDSSGDYFSILTLKNGRGDIYFDPAWYNKHKTAFHVTSSNHPEIARLIQFNNALDNYKRQFFSRMIVWRQSHKTMDGFDLKIDSLIHVWQGYKNDTTSVIYRTMAVKLSSIATFTNDSSLIARIFDAATPTDPLWEYEPNSFSFALYQYKPALLDSFYTHPERLSSRLLQAQIFGFTGIEAKMKKDTAKQKYCYEKLINNYGDLKFIKLYTPKINPQSPVEKGKPVPDFEVTLLHSPKKISNKSLLGKYYLMDFWAVWCGPCRGEMPNLDKAYKRFKDKNFTILSLSFDGKVEDIDTYRRDKWPMPWLHTFLKNGFDNPIAKRFEVTGIPEPILIGPDGIIVETGGKLRGKGLISTLEKHLNEAKK